MIALLQAFHAYWAAIRAVLMDLRLLRHARRTTEGRALQLNALCATLVASTPPVFVTESYKVSTPVQWL